MFAARRFGAQAGEFAEQFLLIFRVQTGTFVAHLAAHGVLFPTCYQGYNERLLGRALQIRKDAGLPAGTFYSLGSGTGSDTSNASSSFRIPSIAASSLRRTASFIIEWSRPRQASGRSKGDLW